jgi:hypothetical protein
VLRGAPRADRAVFRVGAHKRRGRGVKSGDALIEYGELMAARRFD